MNTGAKIGKRAIWFMNSIVDTAVLVIILILIVVGCYAIWDSNQVYQSASSARYQIYKPTAENEGKSFAQLQELNPDVFAWLTVYGTHIDYPVVQGKTNMQYVNINAEGHYSLSGAIFLDSNSSPAFSDFSSILHGHHMEKHAMFGEIGRFAENNYFYARNYGMLYYDGQEHGLEFFAFIHADAYDGSVFKTKITGHGAQQAYLDMLLGTAIHTRNIQVTVSDRLVLLSTCSDASTNGRDILVGRITDERYEDHFMTVEADRHAISVDGLPGLWMQAPPWLRIAIVAFMFIFLLIVKKNERRTRKKKSGEGDERYE